MFKEQSALKTAFSSFVCVRYCDAQAERRPLRVGCNSVKQALFVKEITTVEEKRRIYYNDYDFCFHASNAYYIRKEE